MTMFCMRSVVSRPVVSVVLLACMAVFNPLPGLAQSGSLDNSFANHGIFTANFASADALALQSDGKILVGGETNSRLGVIVRLNPDGTVDHAFGNAGMVTVSFGSIGASVAGLSIQTDGKILATVVGIFVARGQVTRFNANGTVDTSFGTNGFASAQGFTATGPLVLQPDGKSLVLGVGFSTGELVRLDTNGQLDPTFGTGGTALLLERGTSLALLSSGQILVSSGEVGAGPGPTVSTFFGVTRYNANGSVDKTFGILGRSGSFNSPATLALEPSGTILAAGRSETGVARPTIFTGNPTGFAVAGFTPTGSVDTTFGSHGGTTTTFPQMNFGEIAAIALQSNGNIVVAGQAGLTSNNQLSSSFALARYLPTGQLDTTFGTAGRVLTSFGSPSEAFVSAMAIQSDGKIVAAGTSGNSAGNFAVARYLP